MDDHHLPSSPTSRDAQPGWQDVRHGWGVSRRRWLQGAGGLALAGVAVPGMAQFRVEVTGVGVPQIPFAVAPWRVVPGVPQDVAAIVAADLVRSGQLRQLPGGSAVLDEMSRPDLAPWRAQGADALITGSVNRLADGRFDVRFRLWDAVRGIDLGGQSYPVSVADLRLAAHRIADYVYEKLTGERGVFATRIAYVSKNGDRYQLWVADADGENAQPALTSREPIISPAWSPDGKRLYATLTLAGSSQIYALDLDGGAPQRITQTGGIDTEPAFAPDGKAVYFVSDRGGSPQIYRMRPDGGEVTRVTFDGSYNISPAVSPDGRHLAFVSRIGDGFRLRLMDLGTGAVTSLTDTTADESPSFAPNGRLIVYATRVQGRESLMTTTLDGRIKTRLSAAGSVREPDWGPFLS